LSKKKECRHFKQPSKHARDWFSGHGDDAFAAGGLPARRFYGRHRGPFHVVVRLHFFVRDCGFVTGFVHPDADAGGPPDQRRPKRAKEDTAATDDPHLSEASKKREFTLAEFKDKYGQAQSKEGRFYRPIDRTYTWMLKWSMAHRWAIVLLSALVILSTIPLFMFVGKNFLPVDDQSQFEVNLRTPEARRFLQPRR